MENTIYYIKCGLVFLVTMTAFTFQLYWYSNEYEYEQTEKEKFITQLVKYKKEHPNEFDGNSLHITAAHLSEEEVGNQYKLLYKDINKDTAYYIQKSSLNIKHKSQPVFIDYISSAKIVKSEKGSFEVEVEGKEEISTGLSGSRVRSKSGGVIGFVSSLLPNGNLKCISIKE